MTTIRFLPGGGVRKLFETEDRAALGAVPKRASNVEVITTPGPNYGRFHVDFSVMGAGWELCLCKTFDDYAEAVRAEQEWLEWNWVLGPIPGVRHVISERSQRSG